MARTQKPYVPRKVSKPSPLATIYEGTSMPVTPATASKGKLSPSPLHLTPKQLSYAKQLSPSDLAFPSPPPPYTPSSPPKYASPPSSPMGNNAFSAEAEALGGVSTAEISECFNLVFETVILEVAVLVFLVVMLGMW